MNNKKGIFYSIFFWILSLYNSPSCLAINCLGNESKSVCYECNVDSYLSKGLLSKDKLDPTADCNLKDPLDSKYTIELFVSNIQCSTQFPCLGTKSNPFDNLISSLKFIHNIEFAQKYKEQEISIYLLGSPHFLIDSDLPSESNNVRFFRRMNAKIRIQPWFCEDELINGCLSNQKNELIDVVIKTDKFIFEINREFTMKNINLIGRDIILNKTSKKTCFNEKLICCTPESLVKSNSIDECGLNFSTIKLKAKNSLQNIRGMFQLRLLHDENYNELAMLTITPNPTLNLINVKFDEFYSIKSEGWLSLVNFGTLGYIINIQNIIITKSFFSYGFFFYNDIEEDPYYSDLSINQKKLIYNKYSSSNLYFSSFIVNNIIISKFNEYNFTIEKGFLGVFTKSFLFFSNEKNLNKYYFINNTQIENNYLISNWIFLVVNSTNTSNKPEFLINNTIIKNNSYLQFGMFATVNINIDRLVYTNSYPGNFHPIYLYNFGNLLLNNSLISNLYIDINKIQLIYGLDYTVLITNNVIVNYKGSIFYFSRTTTNITDFSLIYCSSSSIYSDVITNHYGSFNLINIKIINYDMLVLKYNYFLYTKSNIPISYNISNISINNMNSIGNFMYFIYLDLTHKSIKIFISNLNFDKYKTTKPNVLGNFIFYYCVSGNYYSSINFENFTINDFDAFRISFGTLEYDLISINNYKMSNIRNNDYISLYAGKIPSNEKGRIDIFNATFENITIPSYNYHFLYFWAYNALLKNLTFININNDIYNPLLYIAQMVVINGNGLGKTILDNVTVILSIEKLFYRKIFWFYNFLFLSVNNINLNCISQTQCKIQPLVFAVSTEQYLINATVTNFRLLLTTDTETAGMIYFSFGKNITLIGNIFVNNTVEKFGIIYVIELNEINIFNNTFINNMGVNGGSIVLRRGILINIELVRISGSIALGEGGALVCYESDIINIKNTEIIGSTALKNGGMLSFDSINKVVIKNSIFNNSISNENGGMFYFSQILEILIEECEIFNSSSILNGGTFYLDNSNLILRNINISTSKGFIGGTMYIKGDFNQNIYFEKMNINNSISEDKASILYFASVKSIKILQVIFSDNYAKIFGGIFLNLNNDDVNAENLNLFNFTMKNAIFFNNSGQFAIIYSSSNYLIFLESIKIENVYGSVFSIESNLNSFISIKNMEIIHCNYFLDELEKNINVSLKKSLIYFKNINITIDNINLRDIINKYDLFEIKYCKTIINNSNFTNFFYMDEDNIRTIFLIKNSNFDFFNSNIFYTNLTKNSIFLNSSISTLNFFNCSLFNAKVHDFAILFLISSNLNLNFITFIYLYFETAVVLVENSNFLIENCNFSNIKNFNINEINDYSISIIVYKSENIENSFFYIKNTFFKNHENLLFINKAANVKIEKSIFLSDSSLLSKTNDCRLAIFANECGNLDIISSSFENFNAKIGGAIHIIQKNEKILPTEFNLINCSFTNNSASFGGNIYLFGSIFLKMKQNLMNNNKALKNDDSIDSGKGGCIIFDCEDKFNCSIDVIDCSFENNTAETVGPTLLIKTNQKTDFKSNNIFKNNYDYINFTDSIASLPLKQYIISSSFDLNVFSNLKNLTNFEKTQKILNDFGLKYLIVASGQPFNFSIINLDQYNQIILTDSNSTAILSCSQNNQSILIEKSQTKALKGILSFENTKIIWFPDSDLNCIIETKTSDSILFKSNPQDSNNELSLKNNFKLEIKIRNCSKGEVLMGDHSCRICSPGTFSIKNPMANDKISTECKICPENSICNGGSTLFPKIGNWRFSENSSLILECANKEACLGSDPFNAWNFTQEELITGKCNENYFGNLCFLCKNGFAKAKDGENCEACSNMIWIYIKIALGIIFIIFYTYVQANIYSNLSNEDPNLAILLKLFVNHFQIIGMVSLVQLGWTLDFKFYFGLQEYFSFLYQDFFNIDCLVQDIGQDVFMQKIIFTILLPIIFCCLMLIVWIISFLKALYKKKNPSDNKIKKNANISFFLSEKMRVTFLTLIFIFYPEILRKCFMLLNCLLLDDSNNYSVLKFSPNVKCWGDDHYIWALAIAFPGISLWGIITPLLIYYVLHKHRGKIIKFMSELKRAKTSTNNDGNILNENREIKKTVIIDIDIENNNMSKLFENIEFPIQNVIRYQKPKYLFYEEVLVNKKIKQEILDEINNNKKINTELLTEIREMFLDDNIQEETVKNEDRLLTDINEFYQILSFLGLNQDLFKENDIKESIIRLRINYELQKTAKNKVRKSIFGMKQKSLVENDNRNDLTDDNSVVFKNLGFIYKGYKEEYYYWEIILFARKFLLIMIGVFSEFFPKKTKDSNLILILITFFFMQLKCKPYQFNYLNKVEILSLLTAAMTAQIGILLYSELVKRASIFFLLIIFIINFIYLTYWIYCLHKYANIKEKLLNYWKNFRRKRLNK